MRAAALTTMTRDGWFCERDQKYDACREAGGEVSQDDVAVEGREQFGAGPGLYSDMGTRLMATRGFEPRELHNQGQHATDGICQQKKHVRVVELTCDERPLRLFSHQVLL